MCHQGEIVLRLGFAKGEIKEILFAKRKFRFLYFNVTILPGKAKDFGEITLNNVQT
jgi:hypothetical protein